MAEARVRIVLCEDDDAIRNRFARLIEDWEGGELLATCGTLAECLALIAKHSPDLLVTDLNLPDGNGITAIKTLRRDVPKAEAMVISVMTDDQTVLDSIEAGASGYLLKDADGSDFIEAITDLMQGLSPISSRIARVLVRRLMERGEARALPVPSKENPLRGAPSGILTPREIDILWGISKGFTYGELAERLGISKQTVPVHIRNIYRKLQVNNRSEAVYEAARQGLIHL